MRSLNAKKVGFILLLVSLVLGTFLYLYKISSIPSGIYADESTVGYNAFSILETGKDEYGKSLPVAFRFFGAYTPPLAVYLTIPFVKLFGLNGLSVRLVSILSTIASIYLVFSFAKSLKIFKNDISPGILSLIFSTAPWVVFNARLGYEVTLGYTLFGLGAFLVWKSLILKKISWLGMFIFSLSTYAAHTERYLVPLFLVGLIVLFKEKIFANLFNKRNYFLCSLLFVSQIPNLYLLATPAFWVKNVAFAGQTLASSVNDFIYQLLVYLSPHTYFGHMKADINFQHFIPDISLFYSWQIIPFLVGTYVLLRKTKKDSSRYLLLMLFTAVIPGSFSGHFISIQRVLTVIIPTSIIITLGIDHLLTLKKNPTVIALVFLTPFSLLMLWRSYFILLPGLWGKWWGFGIDQIAEFAKKNPHQTMIIDNSRDQALYSPILFHLQYPPSLFQSQFSQLEIEGYYKNLPFEPNLKIGNILVQPINWSIDPVTNAYLVGDSLAISSHQATEHFLDPVFTVKDQTGSVLFNVFKTNPQKKQEDNLLKLKSVKK